MLDIKTSDFLTLKNDILKYIKSLDVYENISKELSKPTIDLLASLIAGYASYTNFKYSMNKEETFLQTAKLPTSIFQIAFALGYRFQRAKSPILKFRYFGKDLILNPGDIIGQYTDKEDTYDIIYFDFPKKIKNNDYVNFVLGKYNEVNIETLLNDFNIKIINPQFLRSIDNDNILVETTEGLIKPSIRFEDFILNEKIVNWSQTNTDLILYINDKKNKYGNLNVNNLKIKYIETNGYCDINPQNIKSNKNFGFVETYFSGLNEDTIDKIKKVAPNLRNTKARAVTLDDYYYYIINTNLFEDVYLEPEKNTPANWKLNFVDFDDFETGKKEYALNVEGSYISLTRYDYESLNDFKVRFYNKLLGSELITPKLVKNVDNTGQDIFLEQKFLEREISISGKNINIEKLNDFVKAQSCILNVYYVKKDTEILKRPLTTSELMYLDNYIKNYSIVGIKLVYIPAIPKIANINLEIKLVDDRFQQEVYDFIKKIISKYQYKVNTKLEIENIISEITKYKAFLNGVEIYPVQYVKNLGDTNSINTEKYEYLVFYGIDISFTN